MEPRKREAFLITVCALLSLGLFYLIMLNSWGLSLFGDAVDYKKFGTWSEALAGIGTSTALIIALATFFFQRNSYKNAESRRIVEAETSIFLWLTFKEVIDENSDDKVLWLWDLRIQNSTAAPIYHWCATFNNNVNHLCNYQKRPIWPGENTFNLNFFDNLEPNKTPESTLIFEGQSGRFWSRSTRGIIDQVSNQELNCNHFPKTNS